MNKFIFTKISFAIVILSVIFGNIWKANIFGTSIVVADLSLIVLISVWFVEKLFSGTRFHFPRFAIPLFGFLSVMIISLVWNIFARDIPSNEIISSSMYMFRFIFYSALLFVVSDISSISDIRKYIYIPAFILAVFGFAQIIFVPDFTAISITGGWDPHIGRLASTWLDPNFLGGYLAFVFAMILSEIIFRKKYDKSNTIIASILLIAIIFTYSRSAYLALFISVFIIGLVKKPKIIIIGCIAAIISISTSDRMRDRIIGAIRIDETSSLRIQSWQDGISVWQTSPLLGVGYNTLSYTKKEIGIIDDRAIHSSSGIDSSMITALSSTGIFGLLFYLWFWFDILTVSFIGFLKKTNPNRAISLGLFAGTLAILISAQFVNALFYPFIMVFVFAAIGIIYPYSK